MLNLDIFAYLVDTNSQTDEAQRKRRAYRIWLARNLRLSELKGEELLLASYYRYVFKYSISISDVSLTAFAKTDLTNVVTKNKILITGTEGFGFSDTAQIMSIVELSKRFLFDFVETSREQNYNIDDFVPTAQIYLADKLANGIRAMYNDGSIVLDAVHPKHGSGAYDSLRFIQRRTRELGALYGEEAIDDLKDSTSEQGVFEYVMDLGLGPLDSVFKGMYTSELFSIESGPGVGKTKFAVGHVAWRAAVVYKKNVLYYNLEQTAAEIEALLIARHYYYLYGTFTNEEVIRKKTEYDKLPSSEKQKIEATKFDLFSSGKYGMIHIRAVDIERDTLIPSIELENDLYGFHQIVVVDYVGIVGKPNDIPYTEKEYETIGLTLKELKKFGRRTGAFITVVQQQTKEGAERAQKEQMSQPDDAQGGMIAYRSPDKNLVLYRTEVMKVQNKRGVKITKSRGSTDSLSIVCDTVLGSAIYYTSPADLTK